jgi:uncharacterized protein (TIGR00730 family)
MKRICVNCGSSSGVNANYSKSAIQLGKYLADNQIELVYGGANVGLMGDVANATLQSGGKVIGIITEALANKVKHDKLTETVIVNSMHERKMKMFNLSDAFIALPGGIGTLEELFEVLTWAQLGIHDKPVGLLNIEGYFDKLLDFLDYAVEQRFIRHEHRAILLVERNPATLIKMFKSYDAPTIEKWIDRKK